MKNLQLQNRSRIKKANFIKRISLVQKAKKTKITFSIYNYILHIAISFITLLVTLLILL